MKKQFILALLCVLASTLFYSCIDKEYNIHDINKDVVFSHDNGIFVPVGGDFDTIRFQTFDASVPIGITYIKTVEGFFLGDIYKNFVISNKGVEEALGAITFSGDFLSSIADYEAKEFSNFTVSVKIFKEDGEDTGIQIAEQELDVAATSEQAFDMVINKEDVIKMKDAYTIKIIFDFTCKKIEKDDFVLISNVSLKSSGGIRLNWDKVRNMN